MLFCAKQYSWNFYPVAIIRNPPTPIPEVRDGEKPY